MPGWTASRESSSRSKPMSKFVLIKLYLDPYRALHDTDEQALLVNDVPSYAAARQAIEMLKAGERPAPLTIVVCSRHFLDGFHDLSLLEPWVEIVHIAPRDEIARQLRVQLPSYLSDVDLIAVGVRVPADLLAVAGPQGIHDAGSLENALLARAFGTHVLGSSDPISLQEWFARFVDFAHAHGPAVHAAWAVEPIRSLAEERVRSILERFDRTDLLPFVMDLLNKSGHGEAQAYLSQLAVRTWLRNYNKLARRTVVDNLPEIGRWQDVPAEAPALEALLPWSERLYGLPDHPLCQRVEEVLTLLLVERDLIEEDEPARFLPQTSGRFNAEYNAAQERFGRLLMAAVKSGVTKEQRDRFSSYLAQVQSHFAPLLEKTGQEPPEVRWIDALVEFSDMIHHLQAASPTRWTDWLATYELLIKARHLNVVLREALPEVYEDHLLDLYARFSTLDERLNGAFADWLLDAYPSLVSCSIETPALVMNAARLALDSVATGIRTILLILDGLDWELWQHLRTSLGQEGFGVQGYEAGLAIVPSITEFSRRALFAGLSPRNLASFVDDIYGTEISPQEEAKTLARALGHLKRVSELKPLPANRRIQYLPGELVYVNGSDKDFRQALGLNARCYALVYSEIDSFIHDSKLEEGKLRSTIRQWLTDLAKEVALAIRQNRVLRDDAKLEIIVASDHGFLDVSGQTQVTIDPALRAFLDLERHGRLAIVRTKSKEGTEGIAPTLQLAKQFFDQHALDWHAIWRDQALAMGLAESSPSEGEVIAWLMPRMLRYVARGRGNYVHGGLSMYEMIVPLAVLARGELGIEAPVITLTGRLASEEEGTLSIIVLNKNDRPMQTLVLDVPGLGLAGLEIGDVGPGEVKKRDVSIIPAKSGDLEIELILSAQYSGMPRRFEQTRILAVQPGRRERMRLSTRRSLGGDEDW